MLIYFIFLQAFISAPHLKFQVKHKYGLMSAHNALVAWGKGYSANQATVCLEEFYGWSGYHHDYEIVSFTSLSI